MKRVFLIKKGLRKCYVCKRILPLTFEYFYRSKNKSGGFRQECRECEKKRKIKGGSLLLKLRWEVFQRDNFTCRYCGRKPPECVLEIDHIIPKSKGGELKKENLITACRECNRGKRDQILIYFI